MKYENYVNHNVCEIHNDRFLNLHVRGNHSISIWVNSIRMNTDDLSDIDGLTFGEVLETIREIYGTHKVDIVGHVDKLLYDSLSGWFVSRMVSIHTNQYTDETEVAYVRNISYFA